MLPGLVHDLVGGRGDCSLERSHLPRMQTVQLLGTGVRVCAKCSLVPSRSPAPGSTLTVLTSTLLHSEGDPPVRLLQPLAPYAVNPASVASPLGELLCHGQGTQADTRAATGLTPSSRLHGHCPLLLDMLCLEISHLMYFIWFYFFIIIWFVLNLFLATTSSCIEVEGFLLSKIKIVYLETLEANKFK